MDSIYNNANQDSIYNNANQDSIYNNANQDSIYNDANKDSIHNDANQDSIHKDANKDSIHNDANKDSVYIEANWKIHDEEKNIEKKLVDNDIAEMISAQRSVIDPRTGALNVTAYENYSPVYITAQYAACYGYYFIQITATLCHVILFHGKEIWNRYRKTREEEEKGEFTLVGFITDRFYGYNHGTSNRYNINNH
ncbi:6626_t:CDS:2, partial [Racocetra fulgida]